MLIMSLWSWRPEAFAFQFFVQVTLTFGLATLIIVGFYRFICGYKLLTAEKADIVLLDDQGNWERLLHTQGHRGCISPTSLAFGPFMFVEIHDTITNKRVERFWLCRDQLNEADFRRLYRCIIRLRSHS
ncbi:hypothetical protein FM019_13270 [Aliiglaciecola sp. M165]|nr:hypothetical protein FM019_13270 [Aliiglaciecola sp. M165]